MTSSEQLMVTMNPSPPVCCPQIEVCISLAVASLGETDPSVCDDTCQEMSRFIQRLSQTNNLQIAAFSLGLFVTALWFFIVFIYHSTFTAGRSFRWGLIIIWVIIQLCSLGCQCAGAHIIRQPEYFNTAKKLEDIDCYDKETSKAFGEVVGNIRTAAAVIVGEITIACVAILLGCVTWYSWEKKKAKVSSSHTDSSEQCSWLELAPATGEILLLLMEDVIGIYSYYALTNPTNLVILSLSVAHCNRLSCVHIAAGSRQDIFANLSKYNQQCTRREPHISGSLNLVANAAVNVTCLQNAISSASNYSEPSLFEILVQDAASQVPDSNGKSLVLFTVPTSSAEDGTKTALRLERGVHAGQLETLLMSCWMTDSRTATLESLFVRNPAAKDAGCLPGQYSPEAAGSSSACVPCERNYFCPGSDFYRVACSSAVSKGGSSDRSQ
jgi:hypothetical protein